MSKHGKKMKRIREWAGPQLGEIDIDGDDSGTWLCWGYSVRSGDVGLADGVVSRPKLVDIRVEIPLMRMDGKVDGFQELYVNGNPFRLIDGPEECESMTPTNAEARYGAVTRLRLLKTYRMEILANEDEGLAHLREAAGLASEAVPS